MAKKMAGNFCKAVALITCVSFMMMACASNGQVTVTERHPEPSAQRSGWTSVHDPQLMADMNECARKVLSQGEKVRMASGNICWVAPDGNQYVMTTDSYNELALPDNGQASIDQINNVDATTDLNVEFLGQGLDAFDKTMLGLLAAGVLTLAIGVPILCTQGYCGSPSTVDHIPASQNR